MVKYLFIQGISLDKIQVDVMKSKLKRTLSEHIDYQASDMTHIEVVTKKLTYGIHISYILVRATKHSFGILF